MKKKIGLIFIISAFIIVIIAGKTYWNSKNSKLTSDATVAQTKEKENEKANKQKNEAEKQKNKESKGNTTITYAPMGDSLSDGFFASTEDKKFTQVFADKINKEIGYKVTVGGVSGYGGTSSNGLKGVEKINSQDPDLITLEYGTNDSDPHKNVSVEQFEENMNAMIDVLTKNENKKPKIIMVTTWNQGDKSIPYDNVIKKIAKEKGFPVADISDIWKNPDNKGPKGVDTFKGKSDDWHPNDKGMQQIAERIFKVYEKEFE
ncbi:SGNH/GDSL hydrolase family protein [Bacillus mycoides]|uniref:SGNH/GDSL hydrolase family protein n=1 Tax=Bacillus mycoides TaxID=1405 RepID=UPI003D6462CA